MDRGVTAAPVNSADSFIESSSHIAAIHPAAEML
jgi:hypothetical protein